MKTPVTMGETEKSKAARKRRTQFSVRINFFFFATFILFSLLLGRLAILQFVQGEELAAQEQVWQNRNIPIAPIRGNIYDVNGVPLAYTISSQSLFYQLKLDKTRAETIDLAYRLADAFYEMAPEGKKDDQPDAAEVLMLMDTGFNLDGSDSARAAGYSFSPRRIKANLTEVEIAFFTENRDEFDGIEITEESTRQYHDETIAVQLIGYLRQFSTARNPDLPRSFLDYYKDEDMRDIYQNDELVGFDGLEFMYQEELRGSNGAKTYRINSSAQILEQVELVPPVKGNNLHLTINKDVQLAAENAVEEHLAYMKSPGIPATAAMGAEAVAGYAVAMEVDSGRVIAMVSYPDYDPNEAWDNGRISSEMLNEIQYKYTNGTIRERFGDFEDPAEYRRHPSSLVYLGSTMKPLTVLIGLKEGIITANERYHDPVTFYFGRDRSGQVSNSGRAYYGTLTAATAILRSANTYMSEMIGNRLYMSGNYPAFGNEGSAVDIWDQSVKEFGLGVLTGSGLPGEIEGLADYMNSASRDSPQSALIYASFGQQGKYTALQLAQYTMMLANRGIRYKPLFVDKITSYDHQLVQEIEPEILNVVDLPDEFWDVVDQGMSDVFVQGFEGVDYTFSRKTGTSQQDVAGGMVNNAVLIAYAPRENPKLAVAVVVPEGGFGSWGAAPIARQIFDAYDQEIGLDGIPKGKPQTAPEEASEDEPVSGNEAENEVGNEQTVTETVYGEAAD